jgi:phosphoenolpyruvate-protein kinase (PTS system EI component)
MLPSQGFIPKFTKLQKKLHQASTQVNALQEELDMIKQLIETNPREEEIQVLNLVTALLQDPEYKEAIRSHKSSKQKKIAHGGFGYQILFQCFQTKNSTCDNERTTVTRL